jgi:hypothetical protein
MTYTRPKPRPAGYSSTEDRPLLRPLGKSNLPRDPAVTRFHLITKLAVHVYMSL